MIFRSFDRTGCREMSWRSALVRSKHRETFVRLSFSPDPSFYLWPFAWRIIKLKTLMYYITLLENISAGTAYKCRLTSNTDHDAYMSARDLSGFWGKMRPSREKFHARSRHNHLFFDNYAICILKHLKTFLLVFCCTVDWSSISVHA